MFLSGNWASSLARKLRDVEILCTTLQAGNPAAAIWNSPSSCECARI